MRSTNKPPPVVMTFDRLPAELQIEVFSYLRASDLKAARAVSRKFRDNASPELFRRVVGCARYTAMGAFQNVATHPVLQRYVKEIVLDGSQYDAAAAMHEATYEDMNDDHDDLRVGSFWSKRTRFRRYQQLYNDQEDLKVSGVLFQTLSRALEWMTNVSSIVYSPHPHHVPVESKEMRDLLPRGLSAPSFHGERLLGPGHPFRLLIGAIYLSKHTGVRELRVEQFRDEGEPGTEFSLDVFDTPEVTDIQAGRHLFRNLERCELNIGLSLVDKNTFRRLVNLRVLLATAKELQYLAFHITRWNPSAQTMYGTANDQSIFPLLGLERTWSKLRTLSLEGIYADQNEFVDLIRRHKYTLTNLSFRYCSLLAGTWAEIVDEVVYNTRFLPFVLDSVNETRPPTGQGTTHSYDKIEEWRYEGHVDVNKDGERSFVDVNPAKKSVYYYRHV